MNHYSLHLALILIIISCETGTEKGSQVNILGQVPFQNVKSSSVSQLALCFLKIQSFDLLYLIHMLVCVMNILGHSMPVYIEIGQGHSFFPLLANTFTENSSWNNLRTFVCRFAFIEHLS